MTLDRQTRKRGRQRRIVFAAASLPLALLFSMPHALAQTPGSGFSGLGGDNSKKPIDIYSDSVEVDDKTHIGIFIGNVSATQGDYNLKAPRLEVYYESSSQNQPGAKTAQAPKPVMPVKAPAAKDTSPTAVAATALIKCLQQSAPAAQAAKPQASKPAKPVKAASAGDAGDPMSSGQIKCLRATGGKVVVTSKKDEQEAEGEDAIYDVYGQKVYHDRQGGEAYPKG